MKAAVWTRKDTVEVQDAEAPAGPAAGEVRVGTQAAAVCATDFHMLEGSFPQFKPPLVVGHEVSGVAEQAGEGVDRIHAGDRVALEPTIGCGTCPVCRRGLTHLCPVDWQFVGGSRAGGMAECFCAPAANLHPVPDSVDPLSACLVEPLGCCIHGVDMAGDATDKGVLITGTGFSGVLFVQLLRPLAGRIVVTGRRDVRLRKSLEFGADAAIDVRQEEMAAAVRRHFGREGPDIIIECSGADGILGECTELIARRGVLLVYSYIPRPQTLSIAGLQGKEATLAQATSCADCIPRAIEMVAGGQVQIRPLVTHRFGLAEAAEAYRVSRHEKDACLKAVIELPG